MPIDLGYAAPYKQPLKRCAIYARFSNNNLQDFSSIVDQIRECRETIARMGWVVVEEYVCYDEGTPGQTTVNRVGLEKLLEATLLKVKPFDIIVIDDTSRFGRNLSDTLPITDELAYDGVGLYFAKQELASWEPHFRDLFIKEQRQDEQYGIGLGHKVKRGQKGQVDKGFIGAGRTFGYRNVPIEVPGKFGLYGRPKIDGVVMEKFPEEIAVIQRIFTDHASGINKLQIVHALHREGVPSRTSQKWDGSPKWSVTGITHILNNEKYIGVYIFAKRKNVRNPRTGKKKQVFRPVSEWQFEYRPEMACISLDLWIAAHKQMARTSQPRGQKNGGLNRTEASRKYIFSGLLECAVCGGKMNIIDGGTTHVRYGCHRHRFAGTCPNRLTVFRSTLESELLEYLGENLRTPTLRSKVISEFSKQLKAAVAKRNKAAKLHLEDPDGTERKRAELKRLITNVTDTSCAFGLSPELKARHERLTQQLKDLEPPPVVSLPLESYTPEQIDHFLSKKLEELASVLAGDPEQAKHEMQKRITKLVMTPIQTPEGNFYDISGDVRLFGNSDTVMLDSLGSRSDEHNAFCTLPVSVRMKTSPQKQAA